MRIGIDLTAMPRQPVGAGRYMIQLVRALVDLQAEAQLVIFAQSHVEALVEAKSHLAEAKSHLAEAKSYLAEAKSHLAEAKSHLADRAAGWRSFCAGRR